MKEFKITVEVCLGYHCSGRGEYATGDGSVMLKDEQVRQLVSLIRENGGETDIEKPGLTEKFPSLYEDLVSAYREAAGEACYRHWLIYGFENGFLEEPDGLMEALEEAGLFKYEPASSGDEDEKEDDEDAKNDVFNEWLGSYFDSLSEDEQVKFVETYYDDLEDTNDIGVYDFTVEIPREIVDMAGGTD